MGFVTSKGWANGAMYFGASGDRNVCNETSKKYASGCLSFSAQKSNSIYGGSKVIPISRKCLFLIKF